MSKLTASLVAIGNELLSGRVTDTNSTYLSRRLYELGIEVMHVVQVKDIRPQIVEELSREVNRADIVLTTGGLGPTSDDLTRDALAELAGTRLVENEAARAKLEALFAARARPLNPNNLRQVVFPEDAEVITNRLGTADAFATRVKTAAGKMVPVISLPGVPRELEMIFEEELVSWLARNLPSEEQQPVCLYLRCFGCSESYLGMKIEALNLDLAIEVAYRPMFPEILLTLTHLGNGSRNDRFAELRRILEAIKEAINRQFVLSEDARQTLPAHVGSLLENRGLTVAAAESCTGGLLAHLLVSNAGASSYLASSVVAYSNESKSVFLGVRPAIISRYGAVSAETAREMARGAKYKLGTDFGISITGIAGPDGGTEQKPAGTFWIGIVTTDSEEAYPFFFPHERNMFRAYCAHLALDLLRRKILGYPLTWERK